MRKRMTVLALLLCLLLTACGGEEADSGGQASFLEETFGLEEGAILLTVDGKEIPAWKYLYWLAYACEQVRDRYDQTGTSLDWETPVSGGTLAEYVKEQALADTILYATVEGLAEKYGYETAENRTTEGNLPDMGLDKAQMAQLEEVGQMYAWLYELYCGEGTDLTPTQEELETYAGDCGALTLDRILISAGEDREAARQKAAEMFSRLNRAEDQAAEFTALAAEGADTAGPRTLWSDDTSMDAELLSAAKELEEGQCSGILESQDGFSILRRLETDPAVITEAYFDDHLLTVAEETAVTMLPVYDEINPERLDAVWEEAQKNEETTK